MKILEDSTGEPEYKFRLYCSSFGKIEDFVTFTYNYQNNYQKTLNLPQFLKSYRHIWQQIKRSIPASILPTHQHNSKNVIRGSFQVFSLMFKQYFTKHDVDFLDDMHEELVIANEKYLEA